MYSVVTVTALSVVLGVPLREVKPRTPQGPAPVKRVAVLDQAGQVRVQETLTKEVTLWNKGPLVKGGTPSSKKVTFTRTTAYDPREVQVYDPRGRTVDPKDLPKLLKNPVPVLVSTDGKKVHPFYLRNVKKGTLVLVLPKSKPYPPDEDPPKRIGQVVPPRSP
jgi:hypothetical protein